MTDEELVYKLALDRLPTDSERAQNVNSDFRAIAYSIMGSIDWNLRNDMVKKHVEVLLENNNLTNQLAELSSEIVDKPKSGLLSWFKR